MPEEKIDGGTSQDKEKSLLGVIVHSFFIIPFLIAVFCVLLFAGISLLTAEKHTVYDFLEDVKIGGVTKRWQAAFELSKILANPKSIPDDERFERELISAFRHSEHDDSRVRQYLALAMGRTGKPVFFDALVENIDNEKEENLYAVVYALGMLKDKRSLPVLYTLMNYPKPRLRSIAIVAIGNVGDPNSIKKLEESLKDPEANVQWGAAISLAKLGNKSGKNILIQLLNRDYLNRFAEVDQSEQNHLMLAVIEAAATLNDADLSERIDELSKTDQNMKIRAAAFETLQ